MEHAAKTTRHPQRVRSAARAFVVVSVLSTMLMVFDVAPAHADGPTGFTNASGLTIPGSGDGTPAGAPASTYPANVTVSGMTGTTTNVTLQLNNFSHSSASDVRMLLVSPTGQNLTVLSNVGGGGSLVEATNINLTFDDAAATNVPTGTITTGSYKPTDDNPGPESFPVPAPAPSAATALSTFNGANPNGVWSLYITDNVTGDTGSMAGGFTLTVTTGVVATPGTLEFSSATYSATEGGGTAAITIDRVGGSSGAVSAQFDTVVGGTAVDGSQYSTLTQTVNFADGDTSETVNVTILDNVVVEGSNRTVNLALSLPTGGATLGLAASVLSITDDDSNANATPITIPASGTGNPTGTPAAPYPSDIVVAGRIGTITDVNLTLTNLTHTFPSDISALLVGPAGQNLELLSLTGNGTPASGVTLTFDDAAAGPIGVGDTVVTGTFDPSAEAGGPDPYPAPAPAVSGAAALGTFNGTNPNGTWSLYLIDGASGDIGSLGEWSLSIQTSMTQSVNEGDAVTVDWSAAASQPEEHPLTATLTSTGGPAPLFIQTAGTTFRFIAPRTTSAAGDTMTLDLVITDTVTAGTTTIPVTVNMANIVPTASGSAVSPAVTGQTVALVGGSVDPIEPDQVPAGSVGRLYTWSQTAGPAVTLNPGSNFRNRSFTPPAAGTYTFQLVVTDHGGLGATSAPAIVNVVVRNAPAAGTLSGVVVDPGNSALGGVTVDILATPGGSPIASTTTDGSGAYSFGGLANGASFYVRFSMAGFGTRWAKDGIGATGVRPIVVPNGVVDALLTPTGSLSTIDGNALNSTPAAISGLTVRLYDANGLLATTTTDGAGHYQFTGLTRKPGYTIQLGAGSATFNIAWATTDGSGAVLGSTGVPALFFSTASGNAVVPNITLFNKTTENRSVQVTLTDGGATPINGANVRIYDGNGYVQGQMTSAAGVYTITGLRQGANYKVWVWTKCAACTAVAFTSEWFDDVPGEQFDQSGKLSTLVDLTATSQNLSITLS